MNYIRHLNAFLTCISHDQNLTASHISLYMALFHYWNYNRFQNPFPIYRENILKLSKIGSKNTYHKCIRELHQSKYIYYHPAPSKFLPIKISMVRLDLDDEQENLYDQLDLFANSESESENSNSDLPTKPGPLPKEGDLGGGQCTNNGTISGPNNDTGNVPLLTDAGTDFDTVPVPKLGQNIKHKQNKQESKQPAQKNFDKNEKLSQQINSLAGVPNLIHTERTCPASSGSRSVINPTLSEVEAFFKSNNYPSTEANKFFNHYKAIGWKIKGITPIEDWQAAAHKWMLNAKQWKQEPPYEAKSPSLGGGFRGRPEESEAPDLQYLYDRFLEGQKVFKLIRPEHFTGLDLELTEETIQAAWTERINQLTGTNQHSLNQLWAAYLNGNKQDPLIQNDNPNLLTLAKRIAVLRHFQQQKQIGTQSLSPKL